MAQGKEVSVIIRAKNAVAGGLGAARKQISEWAGSVKGALGSVNKLLGGFGPQLSAAGVIGFFAKGISEAQGAERTIRQLDNTLANFGVNLGKVRPEIDGAIAGLQSKLGAWLDDDEAYAAVDRMVSLTGNYGKSLKNLGLVADVSAKKQISLEQAADIVGKAMTGQTAVLREFGITTKDADEAIAQLAERVKGAAEAELDTFAGQAKAVKNAFGDLAQEVGAVILDLPALQAGTGQAGGAFQKATTWIKENRVAVVFWSSVAVDAVKAAGVTIWNTITMVLRGARALGYGFLDFVMSMYVDLLEFVNVFPREINRMIEGANRLPGIDIKVRVPTLDAEIAKAQDRVAGFRQGWKDDLSGIVTDLVDVGNAWLTIGDSAVEAADKVKTATRTMGHARPTVPTTETEKGEKAQKGALRKAITDSEKRERERHAPAEAWALRDSDRAGARAIAGRRLAPTDQELRDQIRTTGVGRLHQGGEAPTLGFELPRELTIGGRVPDIFQGAADQISTAEDRLKSFGASLDDIASSSIAGFADASANAFEAWITGSDSAGAAFKAAVGDAVRSAALAEGKLNASKAIAAVGEGLFTHRPGAFAAAGKYAAAAAGFFALAGAGGALGGIGGGGGGGSGGSGSGMGSTHDQAAEQLGRPTTVILKGRRSVFDHQDPEDLANLQQMFETLLDTRNLEIQVEP